jgi:hypothetical protein
VLLLERVKTAVGALVVADDRRRCPGCDAVDRVDQVLYRPRRLGAFPQVDPLLGRQERRQSGRVEYRPDPGE